MKDAAKVVHRDSDGTYRDESGRNITDVIVALRRYEDKVRAGSMGGHATSKAKADAARRNGLSGGRPRKKTA
jgi:hypothetical protein